MTQAFPLQWPEGWPRTKAGAQASGERFKQTRYVSSPNGGYNARTAVTFAKARDKLYEELERLGVSSAVISSNHPADVRGMPIESKRKVDDEGVAVYFQYKGRPMVMASDRYDTAAGNMRSIALAIDAMRQPDRHGGGTMMERAFQGFAALPSQANWRTVLGVGGNGVTRATVEKAYRDLAKTRHPDAPGGSTDAMAELNAARDQALREIGP